MNTKETTVARQQRMHNWAQMVHDCQNRPIGMTVNEWCAANSITKADYYYRKTQVRRACLEVMSPQEQEQAVVPVTSQLMTVNATASSESLPENDPDIELTLNGVVIRVTQKTSAELLSKVLGVIAHVK